MHTLIAAIAALLILLIIGTTTVVVQGALVSGTTAFYKFTIDNGVEALDDVHARGTANYQPSTVNFTDDAPYDGIQLPLPGLPFFNEMKLIIYISPNGELSFDSGPACPPPFLPLFGTGGCTLSTRYRNIIGGVVADLYPGYCQPSSSGYAANCGGTPANVEYLVNNAGFTVRFVTVPLFRSGGTVPANERFTFSVSIFPSGRITVRYVTVPDGVTNSWMSTLRHLSASIRYAYTESGVVNEYRSGWGVGGGNGIYAPRSQVIVSGQSRTLHWWPLADICVYPREATFAGGSYVRFATSYHNLSSIVYGDSEFILRCRFQYNDTISTDVDGEYNATTQTLDCIVPALPSQLQSFPSPVVFSARLVIHRNSTNTTIIALPYAGTPLAFSYVNQASIAASAFDGARLCGNCSALLPSSYCTRDCNNVWRGLAEVDTCGECYGGDTGKSAESTLTCDNVCGGHRSMEYGLCVCNSSMTIGAASSPCFDEVGLLPFPPVTANTSVYCVSPRYGLYNETVNVTISTINDNHTFEYGNGTGASVKCVWGGRLRGNQSNIAVFYNATVIVCPLYLHDNHLEDAGILLRVYYRNATTLIYTLLPSLTFTYAMVSVDGWQRIRKIPLAPYQRQCNRCPYSCLFDCYGEVNGTAYIDECGSCIGGLSNLAVGVLRDCAGFCGGPFITNATHQQQCECPVANSAACKTLVTSRATSTRAQLDAGQLYSAYFFSTAPTTTTAASATVVNTFIIYDSVSAFTAAATATAEYASIVIPFTFGFYGFQYRRVYISPHGAVYFNTNTTLENNFVAGLVSDNYNFTVATGFAYPSVTAHVTTAYVRVEFRNYRVLADPAILSFDITLNSTGGVIVVYKQFSSVPTVSTLRIGTRPPPPSTPRDGVVAAADGLNISPYTAQTQASISLCSVSSDICVSSDTIAAAGGTSLWIVSAFITCPYDTVYCAFGELYVNAAYDHDMRMFTCTSVVGTVGSVIAFSLVSSTNASDTSRWQSLRVPLEFTSVAPTKTTVQWQQDTCSRCNAKLAVASVCNRDCLGVWRVATAFTDRCEKCVVLGTSEFANEDCGGHCFGPLEKSPECGCKAPSIKDEYYRESQLGLTGMPLNGAFTSCLYYSVKDGADTVTEATSTLAYYRVTYTCIVVFMAMVVVVWDLLVDYIL